MLACWQTPQAYWHYCYCYCCPWQEHQPPCLLLLLLLLLGRSQALWHQPQLQLLLRSLAVLAACPRCWCLLPGPVVGVVLLLLLPAAAATHWWTDAAAAAAVCMSRLWQHLQVDGTRKEPTRVRWVFGGWENALLVASTGAL